MKTKIQRKSNLWGVLSLMLVSMCSFQASANAPHIRTTIMGQYTNIQQCLQDVAAAVMKTGFVSLDVDSNDVEAVHGEYSTETICMDAKILVIVAGPDSKKAGKLRSQISYYIRNQ